MQDKQLTGKAIKIQNKSYILVKDRIIYFNEEYKNGCIQTELISDWNADIIVVKAIVIPDIKNPDRKFIDYAQEKIGDSYINKTSAMENCSTSAVGRALAYMGIGVIDSIASVDEINKASNSSFKAPTSPVATNKWQKGSNGLLPTKKAVLAQKFIPIIPKTKVQELKEKLFTAGAKTPDEAMEMINKKSGIIIEMMEDLNEEKATLILNSMI